MVMFDKPAETVVFAESEKLTTDGDPTGTYENRISLAADSNSSITDARLVPRHLDTVNALFVDGHVKSMRKDELRRVETNVENRPCFKKTSAFGTGNCATIFHYFQASAVSTAYYY